MSEIVLNDQAIIKNHGKPYIIAEVNSSHNGNIDTAKEMIKKAKEIGCDCVKFQSWSPQSLYSKSYYDENPIAKRIIQKFSLSTQALLEVVAYAKEVGISFSSTPYSKEEVDFLVEQCNPPFIKIASMEINNYDYIEYIAKKGIPVILSTGMAEMEEIRKAVQVFEKVKNAQLILLHCVSIYPAPANTIHLNNILTLMEEFPHYPIGFSDHTDGTEISSGAVALGAGVVEKHFTLDSSKMGMDNNMAMEPDEMAQLVKHCHNIYEAMGSKERTVSQHEYEQRKKMRRSVIANKDLPAGHTLSLDDLDVKRPGTGIPPQDMSGLVGRILKTEVKSDTLITKDNLI